MPWFTNFGLETVDLAAPGVDILSTWPHALSATYTSVESGTSMSTPMVAGAAALLLSAFPGAGVLHLKEALMQGTNQAPAYTGWYLRCVTSGRLNLTRSVMYLSAPWPPTPWPEPHGAPAVVIPQFYPEMGESFPLEGTRLLLKWNGAGYDNCTLPMGVDEESGEPAFWVDTDVEEAQDVSSISDDGSQRVVLNRPFQLFGRSYSYLFVGANGYVTFGTGNSDWSGTLVNHYNLPRISALFTDLTPDPPASRIELLEVNNEDEDNTEDDPGSPCWLGSGGVAITYRNLRHYITGSFPTDPIPRSTFQILISYEGNVELAWKEVYLNANATVGLSDGYYPPAEAEYSLDYVPECNCDGLVYDAPAVVVPAFTLDTDTFPLDGFSLLYTWNGSAYENCTTPLHVDRPGWQPELPVNTSLHGGEELQLSDDGSSEFFPGRNVSLFGRVYNSFYVVANGYISFGSQPEDIQGTLDNHYRSPQVSALFTDLTHDPPYSSIEVAELPPSDCPFSLCPGLGTSGGVVITYRNMRHYVDGPVPVDTPRSTFQLVLAYDGSVMMAYTRAHLKKAAVVGLSDGVPMHSVRFNNSYSLQDAPPCLGETCLLQIPMTCRLHRVRFSMTISPGSESNYENIKLMVAYGIATAMSVPPHSPRIELSNQWVRDAKKPGCRTSGPVIHSQWDMWFNTPTRAMEFWKWLDDFGIMIRKLERAADHICYVHQRHIRPEQFMNKCMETAMFESV
eukprot:jgi/Tetstr1/421065/TSEL_012110.t1